MFSRLVNPRRSSKQPVLSYVMTLSLILKVFNRTIKKEQKGKIKDKKSSIN